MGALSLFAPTPEMVAQAGDAASSVLIGELALVALLLAYLVALDIAMVWVARDSKTRDMPYGLLWMLAVFVLGPAGLALYLCLRPRGAALPCHKYASPRLYATQECTVACPAADGLSIASGGVTDPHFFNDGRA
jgi:hypothetical protein